MGRWMAYLSLVLLVSCGGGGSKKKNRAPRIDPIDPITIQAGQLLTMDVVAKDRGKAPPILTGEVRGTILTGGILAPFDQVEGVEFDGATGRLELRVPPRETDPMEVRFVATDAKKATLQDEEIVPVTVTPPNLYDGILVDGIFDAFEVDLILPSHFTVPSVVEMFDVGSMASVGFIQVEYDIAADPDYIYLRITWEDPTEDRLWDLNVDQAPRNVDILQILIDQDGDGTLEDGEDLKMVFPYLTGSSYIDQHEDSVGTGDDPTVNGIGRMAYDSVQGAWTAELLIDREADAYGQDADLTSGAQVPFNILFVDSMGSTAPDTYAGGLYGFTVTDASGWGDLPLPGDLNCTYAPRALPTQGTFVCVSDHEDPNGEVYEVDLGTMALVRLTNNNRYEDWVSVAPDGSFAAYGSSTGQNDFNAYEIYKWERSTGLETELTNNLFLDGHPGISPDNQRIVYVTFNLLGTADFYVMDRDGGGVVRITNDNVEENDPEWTKDGRLAIKSSRQTGRELMAVMDEDGTNLVFLTDHTFSDHDGMVSPNNRWILYERFESSVVWNSDWNLTNSTTWTIRMVSLDGLEHRLLVDAPLVAWLPVMGPEGIVAYFRSTAFNGREVRMIDRFGVDLGRLAPIQSSIRYMDWK